MITKLLIFENDPARSKADYRHIFRQILNGRRATSSKDNCGRISTIFWLNICWGKKTTNTTDLE